MELYIPGQEAEDYENVVDELFMLPDEAEPTRPPSSEGNQTGIDFAALQATNKDFIAWLKVQETKIIDSTNKPCVIPVDML